MSNKPTLEDLKFFFQKVAKNGRQAKKLTKYLTLYLGENVNIFSSQI